MAATSAGRIELSDARKVLSRNVLRVVWIGGSSTFLRHRRRPRTEAVLASGIRHRQTGISPLASRGTRSYASDPPKRVVGTTYGADWEGWEATDFGGWRRRRDFRKHPLDATMYPGLFLWAAAESGT